MKVLLATPTATAVTIRYAASLARLIDTVARTRPEIEMTVKLISGSVIYRSRNVLANIALGGGFDRLLFIDSDMGFAPTAVTRLLDSRFDVCGCLYPSRVFDEHAFYRAARQTGSAEDAAALSTPYVSEDGLVAESVESRKGLVVRDGFVEARRIGMGITSITVDALRRVADAIPEIRLRFADPFYDAIPGADAIHLFFDPMPVDGQGVLGEDYSFCKRWTKGCGGKIYALVDERIAHVGTKVMEGVALKRLAANLDSELVD